MISASAGGHLHVLSPLCLLWMCILVYLCCRDAIHIYIHTVISWYLSSVWLLLGVVGFHTVFNVFVFIQYTDSSAKSLIFFIAMWLLCNCCRICFCSRKGIIVPLPFIAMPSKTAGLLLISHLYLMLCSNSSFLCGQLCIMYDFSFCRWASSCFATSMSSLDVHTGIFML